MVNDPETRRVMVTRAALCDVGRPDLAALVRQNRIGDPTIREPKRLPADDTALLLRAYRLGHEADPDGRPHRLRRD